MVAGRPLFGEGLGAVAGHLTREPPLLGDQALDSALRPALAKDPAERYPSLRELANALLVATG
jgi:hypothetical protein